MKSLNDLNINELASYECVFLYGASNTGKLCLKELKKKGLNANYFIDDTEYKIGKDFEGLMTISYEEFVKINIGQSRVAVIITTTYAKVVLEKLKEIDNARVYIMFDIIWKKDINELHEKSDVFSKLFSNLNTTFLDKNSISVYQGIQKYLQTGDSNYLIDIATSEECYFTPEILSALEGRSLRIIDAGAHDGDLIRPIKKFNLEIDAWHCFEPDPSNFDKLLANRDSLNLEDVMVCHNIGLWDVETELHFNLHEGGTNSKITLNDDSDFKIRVKTIDAIFENLDINFIKMDIEGAELNALKGGLATIIRNRPLLAISIYHSIEDFFDIYNYLIKNLPNYRFEVKQHAVTLSETVLYCFPK